MMKLPILPPWLLIGGAVTLFASWTLGVYLVGAEAGRDDTEAASVPALIAAVNADRAAFTRDMAEQKAAVVRAYKRTEGVRKAVEALSVEAKNDPAYEPCPVTPERYRRLRAAFERIDAAAGAAAASRPVRPR